MGRQRSAVVCRSVFFVGVTPAGVPGAKRRRVLDNLQTLDTPLALEARGSFFVGARMPTSAPDLEFLGLRQVPDRKTLHGDHAHVFCQIPVNRRKLSALFCTGQFSKTPSGRPFSIRD